MFFLEFKTTLNVSNLSSDDKGRHLNNNQFDNIDNITVFFWAFYLKHIYLQYLEEHVESFLSCIPSNQYFAG